MSRDQERSSAEQRNAQRLREAIHSLRTRHVSVLGHVSWRAFWDHSKQITQMFRDAKPLRAETREQLWAEVSELRDEMKRRQDREYQARRTVSERRKALVIERIAEAELTTRAAPDVSYLRRADKALGEAMEMMKGGWGHLNDTLQEVIAGMFLDDGKMLRDDHQECWERWKTAKDGYHDRLTHLRQLNYEQAQRRVAEAWNAASVGDPYEALEVIKTVQSDLRGVSLPGDSAHLVWDKLNEAWAKASSRIDSLREEKRRKHEEWQRKQGEWRERMHDHISRWEADIDRGEDFVRRLEGQIDDLHDKLANAWSDDYVSNIEGWIREKEHIITDVQRRNQETQEKIDDVRRKLNS